MSRSILAALLWLLSALGYFVLLHIMDREGFSGTLLAGHPPLQHVFALLALMGLRVAVVLVFPAVLFALVVEALLARILRGSSKARADQSMIEASQIGSSDQHG